MNSQDIMDLVSKALAASSDSTQKKKKSDSKKAKAKSKAKQHSDIAPSSQPKKKGGPPSKAAQLDDNAWSKIQRMGMINCTTDEIASIYMMSVDTLNHACMAKYDKSFAEWIAQFKGQGKMSLRRKLYHKAVNQGDTSSLIWLSKNYLAMSDKVDSNIEMSLEHRVVMGFAEFKEKINAK